MKNIELVIDPNHNKRKRYCKHMNAWLVYTEYESIRNKQYINFYIDEGKKFDIIFKVLIAEELEFGVKDSKPYMIYQGEIMKTPDFVICRMMYPLLTMQLETMGIKVFNNSMVSNICNDKAKTYQYVVRANVPIVETIFCKKELVRSKLESISLPRVIKTTGGHGGTQVYLLNQNDEIEDILTECDGEDMVIQPYVGKKNQDLRVYVIGQKIIAAVLRTAKEGFKSNFCLGGDVRLYTLSKAEKEIVHRIIELFDFGLVGIDFIIGDQGELLFNEIEDVVGSRMLYLCSDINIVKLYLEYIIHNIEKN